MARNGDIIFFFFYYLFFDEKSPGKKKCRTFSFYILFSSISEIKIECLMYRRAFYVFIYLLLDYKKVILEKS